MADRDDVRARVEDALQRAASTAYEAAHGAMGEEDAADSPPKWRLWATPRVVVTVTLLVALVGGMIAFAPRSDSRAPLSLASASAPASVQESTRETTEAATADTVVVHVAGAVRSPGVYTVEAGLRVGDAVEAAGGAVDGADLDGLNLARLVVDGEQVKVPLVGEVAAAGEAGAATGLINVNTADATALEALPGVGPVLAARIVTYRDAHGQFSSIEELDDVSGVGPAILEQISAVATV